MFAFLAQSGERVFAVNRLHPAALQIVIAGVERIPKQGQLLQIPDKRILHKLVSPASGRRGQIGELLSHIRRYMYVHWASLETGGGAVNVEREMRLATPEAPRF